MSCATTSLCERRPWTSVYSVRNYLFITRPIYIHLYSHAQKKESILSLLLALPYREMRRMMMIHSCNEAVIEQQRQQQQTLIHSQHAFEWISRRYFGCLRTSANDHKSKKYFRIEFSSGCAVAVCLTVVFNFRCYCTHTAVHPLWHRHRHRHRKDRRRTTRLL